MSKLFVCCVLTCLISIGVPTVFGQGPPPRLPQKPDNAQSLVHLEAAKKIAGNDALLAHPYNFYCIPANNRGNSFSTPDLEPVKIFDNLYAVGNSETTVYALTTSDGIILFDAGGATRVETVLLPGLEKLGLDPSQVKYILLGHGHGDHYGGSNFFQDKYRTRVGTTAEDWDTMYPANPPANQQDPPGRPKRDLVVVEGQPLTLGDVTVTFILTPGHTPGALAFIFPVKDKGATRIVGLFGGTALDLGRLMTPELKTFVTSIHHLIDVARKMHVDVEVQNHAIFDGFMERLAILKTLKPGEPNPFLIGNDRYLKFWNVVSECVQAEIARRGDG